MLNSTRADFVLSSRFEASSTAFLAVIFPSTMIGGLAFWYSTLFNELTEQEDAYEIWIRDGEQNILVYYFFPYDIGVIEWGVKNA